MSGVQWLYHAAIENHPCEFSERMRVESPSKIAGQNRYCIRYKVADAGEGPLCLYVHNPDTFWDSTYALESYEQYLARNGHTIPPAGVAATP